MIILSSRSSIIIDLLSLDQLPFRVDGCRCYQMLNGTRLTELLLCCGVVAVIAVCVVAVECLLGSGSTPAMIGHAAIVRGEFSFSRGHRMGSTFAVEALIARCRRSGPSTVRDSRSIRAMRPAKTKTITPVSQYVMTYIMVWFKFW
jgi:hypothetical protein